MAKTPLQSKFTLLKSKIFGKIWREKITMQRNEFNMAKERGPIIIKN
jgi:hypothetical protein